MAIEIERKFLVKNESFKVLATQAIPIEQGYMTNGGDCAMRVRIVGGKGMVTIKSKSKKNSIARYEWEYPIPVKDVREMMRVCVSNIIKKTRYLVPVGKHVFEVDVFHGENAGLVVAEIELSKEDELFEIPDWIGKEVTKKKQYHNAFIARNPYKTWKKSLRAL